MKSFRIVITVAIAVMVAVAASAQSRGNARVQGKIVDPAGQPIQDVIVKAQMVDQTDLMQAKSNKKGEWQLNGLANGQWKIEFSKEGLDPVRQQFEIRDDRAAPMNITMGKPQPKEDPTIAINAELQKAVQTAQAGKFADARKICEDLVAKNPTLTQCHAFIARMYAAENNAAEGVKAARVAVEKEPANVENKLLLADLLMEAGQKAESKQILDAIDLTQVKDPFPFINLAISQINEGKGVEAAEALTKLQPQFANQAEIYYYRGRAYLAASKFDEAKADLEKFVTMGKPDSKEVADAKKILEQINKK
jgi:predicted Zn-dependent protease